MEEGVLAALRDVAETAGLGWSGLVAEMIEQGRLHFETY